MSSQFFLTAANFSIPALSLKFKCNVLHVQTSDIKEASSVFWSRGITRGFEEKIYTAATDQVFS
jgi:tRNA(Phe) wybutosine-synthesizing methylase Tyw3